MTLELGAVAQLACPVCSSGGLTVEPHALHCAHCQAAFPDFAGVPCLVKESAEWRATWWQHALDFEQETNLTLAHWQAELALPELLPRSRARLQRLIEAKKREFEVIAPLFVGLARAQRHPLGLEPTPRPRSRLAVFDCYEHLFRDWCWGAEESQRLLELGATLAGVQRERVAVYGAGAGRFALELHRALSPQWTFALDQNPLPLTVADRLLRGEVLRLNEYPVSPVHEKNAVVSQELQAPVPRPDGLCLLIADALHPPFAAASLDLVVTPWFIDVCGVDFRAVTQEVHRVLRQGGQWWILGPLDFDTWLSRAYCLEEVLELVELAGFDVARSECVNLPYFQSPHSGSQRTDTIVSIIATKTRSADSYATWLAQLDPALRLAMLE